MSIEKDAYTIDDLARRYGCCRRTIAREIERKRLKAFRIGRSIRISRAALAEYEESGK